MEPTRTDLAEENKALREALHAALADLEGYRRNCQCEGGGDVPSDGERLVRKALGLNDQ